MQALLSHVDLLKVVSWGSFSTPHLRILVIFESTNHTYPTVTYSLIWDWIDAGSDRVLGFRIGCTNLASYWKSHLDIAMNTGDTYVLRMLKLPVWFLDKAIVTPRFSLLFLIFAIPDISPKDFAWSNHYNQGNIRSLATTSRLIWCCDMVIESFRLIFSYFILPYPFCSFTIIWRHTITFIHLTWFLLFICTHATKVNLLSILIYMSCNKFSSYLTLSSFPYVSLFQFHSFCIGDNAFI